MDNLEPQAVAIGESMALFSGGPPQIGGSFSFSMAGAESNVCIGLARLGHRARWLSALGEDSFGRAILKTLRGEGVDVCGVRIDARAPTGAMFKVARPLAEPSVVYHRAGSAFSRLDEGSFDASLWRGAKYLLLSGITPALSIGCRALWEHALRDARAHGVAVWLDPNFRSRLWSAEAAREAILPLLPFVNCVLPGLAEGEMLSGRAEPQDIARELMGLGAASVAIKAGEAGAFWFGPGERVHAPPFVLEQVVDPIGAGDGFAAGLLSGELDGLSRAESLRRAHAVGALVCASAGDWEGLPSRAEVEDFLAGRTASQR